MCTITSRTFVLKCLQNNFHKHFLYKQSYNQFKYYSTTQLKIDEFIIKSPTQDVPNIIGATVPEYVQSLVGKWGNSPAYECGITGFKITHNEVWKTSKSFAAALLKSDLKRGDTVGIVLPNHPYYASVLYGILDAGLIASPVNPAYFSDEIVRQLQDSNSKCAVTISAFLPAIQAAKKSNPNFKSIIILGEPEQDCHTFSEMIKTDSSGVSFLKGSEINTAEEVALLPYSSGTTGLPKGVMLTHASLVDHLNILLKPGVLKFSTYEDNNESGERLIGLLPFFHAFGMTNNIIIGLATGSFTVCLPKFDPLTFLQAIRKYKPTILHLVPPLINFIAASPDYGKNEFESVHTIVGGAAPIGQLSIKHLLKKVEKYIFFQEAYGMTEMSPGTHTLRENTNNKKIGSCGVPMPNTICKIIAMDGSKKSLGPNQNGEICVKGPQMMKGYWKNEEATKNTIDADGWLHTGDIGYYDEENHLYVVDRLKELIKVKGFQVAPAELEELLRSHKDISDAAVIGISDPDAGELPRAYIVKRNTSLNSEMVHQFVKEKVTAYKQLKGGIEFVENIPKAPSGKILRRELKKAYCDKQGINT